jgi:phage terminase large subunit-like protein
MVHARRSKQVRAEPVAALAEQGRLHMVGTWPELEEQLTTWVPNVGRSPDRLDAMVYAVTALAEGHRKARMVAGGRLPALTEPGASTVVYPNDPMVVGPPRRSSR